MVKLAPRVLLEQPVHQAKPDLLVLKVIMVQLELLVIQAVRVQLGLQDQQERLDPQEKLALVAQLVLPVKLV